MFWVISPRFDVLVLEQARGQQRFLACSLASAGVEEERDQEGGSGRQQHDHQRGVAVGLENPEHDEEHADRRQDRSERVEGTGRVGREGVGDPAAEQDDQRDDRGLEDERGPPADRGGDETADQRSGGGAEASQPADDAERPSARGEVAEMQCREDVDGRDQQGGADALQHRVAEDQHSEPRRHRAQQRADPVQHEADGEAAFAAPTIAQLAARDHEDRHDQQEQGDRRLHTLHGRVQVLGDVVDHHVHVRARETADELGKRERSQESAPRDDRACRCGIRAQPAARFAPAPAARTSRATKLSEKLAERTREVGDVRPPPRVVLLGESARDPAEHLGADGHHPDDLAKDVALEPLAPHVPDTDRLGGLIAGMLAKLERVSRH